MLANILNKLKQPFIRIWDWFILETFEGTIKIKDLPDGGSTIYQVQKLFGIKFKVTVVKHIDLSSTEASEALLQIIEKYFEMIGERCTITRKIEIEDGRQDQEHETIEIKNKPAVKKETKRTRPTKKTTSKKKAKTKKKPRK